MRYCIIYNIRLYINGRNDNNILQNSIHYLNMFGWTEVFNERHYPPEGTNIVRNNEFLNILQRFFTTYVTFELSRKCNNFNHINLSINCFILNLLIYDKLS